MFRQETTRRKKDRIKETKKDRMQIVGVTNSITNASTQFSCGFGFYREKGGFPFSFSSVSESRVGLLALYECDAMRCEGFNINAYGG